MSALAPRRRGADAPAAIGVVAALAFVAAACAVTLAVVELGGSDAVLLVALAALLAAALWLFLSERVILSSAILLLYLGLADGYVKLSTGSSTVTLARDLLLYGIVAGMLARAALRGERIRLPPLSGWVLAFVAVVLVQVANPANAGVLHTLGALRPHLEFVPLFFLGYMLVRSRRTLYGLLLLLLLCATANGIVGLVQLDETPEQLAAWGPGYAAKVEGTGDVSGRVFTDEDGDVRVRPFGLGGDSGSGAIMGLIAVGAALALVPLSIRRPRGALVVLLSVGPPLALITGERRSAVVAAFVAVLAFVLLTTSARRLVPTLAAVLLGAVATFAVMSVVASSTSERVFDRYRTIAPDRVTSTTQESRGGSFAKIPRFMVDHPFGGGLGSVGPAASFAGGTERSLDGETGPTFLLSELGIAGLALLLGLNLRLLWLAFTRVRRFDHELRLLLGALVAGLVGLLATWVSSSEMATSPAAPFFWLSAGVLAWWTRPSAAPDGGRSAFP